MGMYRTAQVAEAGAGTHVNRQGLSTIKTLTRLWYLKPPELFQSH